MQSGQITGGSYSNNTLTLNRQAGDINIGGFPSGGAQSVDVSLSGSTLTVNVDGHSDSVNISSAVQNREFSISFPNEGYANGVAVGSISIGSSKSNLYGWNSTSVSSIECPFGTSQAYISSFNPNCDVKYVSLSRGNSGQEGLRVNSISDTSENIAVSGSGSGTIRIYGYFQNHAYSGGDFIFTTSSKPYLELTINNGSLSSVSSNFYIRTRYTALSLQGVESITLT